MSVPHDILPGTWWLSIDDVVFRGRSCEGGHISFLIGLQSRIRDMVDLKCLLLTASGYVIQTEFQNAKISRVHTMDCESPISSPFAYHNRDREREGLCYFLFAEPDRGSRYEEREAINAILYSADASCRLPMQNFKLR